jgi:hypothetical protein
MKVLVYSILALFLILFSSAQLLNADGFIGDWVLEKNVKNGREDFKPGEETMTIEKVMDGYYRAISRNGQNLLLKEVNDTELFSNFNPKVNATLRLLDQSHMEIRILTRESSDTNITVFKKIEIEK